MPTMQTIDDDDSDVLRAANAAYARRLKNMYTSRLYRFVFIPSGFIDVLIQQGYAHTEILDA